jgi:hypothetical protein
MIDQPSEDALTSLPRARLAIRSRSSPRIVRVPTTTLGRSGASQIGLIG